MLKGLVSGLTLALIALIVQLIKRNRYKKNTVEAEKKGCWVCEQCLSENPDDSTVCHHCGRERQRLEVSDETKSDIQYEADKPETVQKCELCGKDAERIISAVITDNMGKRHRKICEDCFGKYNCKEDK